MTRGTLKALGQADLAVAKFHQQLDAGSFDQIYNDSDSELKSVTTQQKFRHFLAENSGITVGFVWEARSRRS
jgi:hypothetical protein